MLPDSATNDPDSEDPQEKQDAYDDYLCVFITTADGSRQDASANRETTPCKAKPKSIEKHSKPYQAEQGLWFATLWTRLMGHVVRVVGRGSSLVPFGSSLDVIGPVNRFF